MTSPSLRTIKLHLSTAALVQLRQAKWKISEVASSAKKALWFAETFGLVPESLTLKKAVRRGDRGIYRI